MPVLDLAYHELSPADFDEVFNTDFLNYGEGRREAQGHRRRPWSCSIAAASARNTCI